MRLSKGKKAGIVIALTVVLLVVDQVTKILVKTNMHLGESISVFGDWFQILFIENEGMAFGMSFGGDIGKYILTSFRLILSVLLLIYLRHLLRKKDAPLGVLLGLAAIMTGAVGNLIDCMFYGRIFEASTYSDVAGLVPYGEGYAPFGLGKVVDMLYFPIINTTWPDWVPGKGGDSLIFFRPIFNIADSCVTVGALYLLIFKWKYFQTHELSK